MRSGVFTQYHSLSVSLWKTLPSCFLRTMILKYVFRNLLILIFLLAPSLASAATYYINPSSRNDAKSGRSTSAPWRTLSKANGTLVAGDTVYLMTGTHTGTIQPAVTGTASLPITYAAQSGATVEVSGAPQLIILSNKNYITIQGPIIFRSPTTAQGYWGYLQNADNNTITGNTFTGVKTNAYVGLSIQQGSSYNRITSNTFRDWGSTTGTKAGSWGDAVRVTSDSDRNLIEGNNLYNAGHSGLTVETSYNVIRNNYFKNAWWRGLQVYWVKNPSWDLSRTDLVCQYNVVEGNLLDSNGSQVTASGGEAIQPGTPYSIFRRNVFVNNRTSGLRMGPWPTSGGLDGALYTQGNRIYHNTFVHNGTSASVNEPGGFVLWNNGVTSVDVSNIHYKNNIFTKNTASTNQFWIALSTHSELWSELLQYELPHCRKLLQSATKSQD